MNSPENDILISGGGIAGLTAAAAFGSAGFRTLCVDPVPPVAEPTAPGADLRTTAFLQPSRKVLEAAGLWQRLAPHAAPLQVMRIIDAAGQTADRTRPADFDAAELGDEPFAWNLPNWLLRRETMARLDEIDNVGFRPGTATTGLVARLDRAHVRLSDGTTTTARLVIAADGRDSPMRRAAGIGARTWRYGQKALVFTVTHPVPTGPVSTEIHRSGGPFTVVPLPDHEGEPRSAVVWMEEGPKARRLAALSAPEFAAAATERSGGRWGEMRLVSPVQVWPMIARLADRMNGPRIALMAEAAHVVPPIGAQGLNMSLADLDCLLELARVHAADPGAAQVLDRYHRARHPVVAARVFGIDKLNRISMAGSPLATAARGAGLRLIHDVTPVRRALMRAGLGPGLF